MKTPTPHTAGMGALDKRNLSVTTRSEDVFSYLVGSVLGLAVGIGAGLLLHAVIA